MALNLDIEYTKLLAKYNNIKREYTNLNTLKQVSFYREKKGARKDCLSNQIISRVYVLEYKT